MLQVAEKVANHVVDFPLDVLASKLGESLQSRVRPQRPDFIGLDIHGNLRFG